MTRSRRLPEIGIKIGYLPLAHRTYWKYFPEHKAPALALVEVEADTIDQAIDMLERAARQGGGNLGWIRQDPDFDSLRDDPRFQRLVAVMSGVQAGAAT